MAMVLMQREVGDRAIVRSAGTWPNDLRSPHDAVSLMEERGLSLQGHRSQVITEAMVRESSLIITMERAHVAHVVSLMPEAFPRTFTLPDLARRAEAVGPRGEHRPLTDWLRYVHGDRTARSVLARATVMSTSVKGLTGAPSESDPDEIADPYGLTRQAFVRCAAELEGLLARFVAMAWPS
jgi:protein-tyrosine phosphatase